MVNYENAKVYKIVCNVTNKIYVGSTCKKLCQRIAAHRTEFKSWKSGKRRYITSFEIIENENYDIILLELFPCNSKEELHMRERYYIDLLECVNKVKPLQTPKEYYVKHTEAISKKNKIIYDLNKEEKKEKSKIYYEKNKETCKKTNKIYYEKNIEACKEKRKIYYEKNKEALKKKKNDIL